MGGRRSFWARSPPSGRRNSPSFTATPFCVPSWVSTPLSPSISPSYASSFHSLSPSTLFLSPSSCFTFLSSFPPSPSFVVSVIIHFLISYSTSLPKFLLPGHRWCSLSNVRLLPLRPFRWGSRVTRGARVKAGQKESWRFLLHGFTHGYMNGCAQ